MAKTIKEVAPKIESEGRVITYLEFLESVAGEIFNDTHSDILKAASLPQTEWIDVIEYVAPLTTEVLSIAVETDREVYLELIESIKRAYDKLKSRHNEDEETLIDFDINMTNGHAAERFEKLAEYMRQGWEIERVSDNTAGDGHYYFTLVKQEGGES